MRAAIYARVSTTRQAQTQKADQQIERLKAYAKQKDCGRLRRINSISTKDTAAPV
jgi:DNA invertase Pin-like site-specific DNA recombinase